MLKRILALLATITASITAAPIKATPEILKQILDEAASKATPAHPRVFLETTSDLDRAGAEDSGMSVFIAETVYDQPASQSFDVEMISGTLTQQINNLPEKVQNFLAMGVALWQSQNPPAALVEEFGKKLSTHHNNIAVMWYHLKGSRGRRSEMDFEEVTSFLNLGRKTNSNKDPESCEGDIFDCIEAAEQSI